MSRQLADKLKENFPKVFTEKEKQISFSEYSVNIRLGSNTFAYPFRIINNILVVGGAVGAFGADEIRKKLKLNESAAKDFGLSQINYDADDNTDREIAAREGYVFEDKSYVGVKKL